MIRQAGRHAQASLRIWLGSYLTSLGWIDYELVENDGSSELSGRAPRSATATPLIVVTLDDQSRDVETELGGGNREVMLNSVVDVLCAPPARARGLAEDIFDLVAGRTLQSNLIPFINQTTNAPVTDETLRIETASMGVAIPSRADWYQVSFQVFRAYRPDNYVG